MQNNNNEIDIIELILKIYIYTKKYILVFAIAIILGAIVGFFKNKTTTTRYKSEMIIISKIQNDLSYKTMARTRKNIDVGDNDVIVNIIKAFQQKLSNKNYVFLSKQTKLTELELKNITTISAKIIEDDNSADFDYLSINVNSTKPDVYKNLSLGIINYINNNNYIKNKYKKDSILIQELIAQTDKKINDLEEYSAQKFDKNNNDFVIMNDNSVYGESVHLMAYKQKLVQELNSLKTATIIEDFYIPNSPIITSSTKVIIMYSVIFFILSILLVLLLIINKKAKEYVK